MANKKSIYLWGYYGSFNIGDDLLLSTLVDKLKEIYPSIIINVLVMDPKAVSDIVKSHVNLIETPTLSKYKVKRILDTLMFHIKQFKKNNIIVFGGGTNLFETPNRSYQSLLIKYLVLQYNALFYKRKVLHIGVGIGLIYSKLGKLLLKKILKLSEMILLRDEVSYEYAIDAIGSNKKIIKSFDLVFLNSYRRIDEIKKRKIKVAFSFFYFYGYITNDAKYEDFKDKVINFISLFINKFPNVEIYLFSFQKNIGGKDQEFNELIMNETKYENLHHIRYSSDTEYINARLSEMDLCIGMRLHFCLMALLNKIPTIGINYQPKVNYEFASLGLKDYCVEIDNIEKAIDKASSIIYKDISTIEDYSKAFQKISDRKKQLEEQLNSILDIFLY